VAKLHKLADRRGAPGRLVDKDAHDIYRLLVATPTRVVADRLRMPRAHDLAGPSTTEAIEHLRALFAAPDAVGAVMAGRAEELVGDPVVVAAAVAALVDDLLTELDTP
jgi:hypothetical protein